MEQTEEVKTIIPEIVLPQNTTLEVQDASVSFCMTYEIPESSKEE